MCVIGKRYAILKKLKDSLTSDKKKLNDSISYNYEFVSVPLETGISVPGCKKNCTPAGKMGYII